MFVAAERDELYEKLLKCKDIIVHKKDDEVMEKYHYSNNNRISPIVLSTPKSADGKSAKLIKITKSENWTLSKYMSNKLCQSPMYP